MNRILSSALAVGAGMAAYGYLQSTGMMDKRQIRKLQKRISKVF